MSPSSCFRVMDDRREVLEIIEVRACAFQGTELSILECQAHFPQNNP